MADYRRSLLLPRPVIYILFPILMYTCMQYISLRNDLDLWPRHFENDLLDNGWAMYVN